MLPLSAEIPLVQHLEKDATAFDSTTIMEQHHLNYLPLLPLSAEIPLVQHSEKDATAFDPNLNRQYHTKAASPLSNLF